MFTSYIKSLNDMVYSTSESPEEQPSTGVLGRIGSWFSPWRGKGPKTPSENASPTGEPPLPQSEGEQESEGYVRTRYGEDKNPGPKALFRDSFPREGEDATQSAHRGGSVASGTGTAEGGPKEEEPVGYRQARTGQGNEWEERSNGASASWISEENATHLTHRPTPSEQGVAWDSDQAHRRAQAQASKRLHVYLEETSVIHCGQDADTEKEVFRTTVTKSLHVLPKLKSSSSFENPTNAEEEGPRVTPAVGSQHCSAPEGASLKSHKDSGGESDRDQAQADSMGRKNASRRRSRKNSQGDGANAPQEKAPQSAPPVPEGVPSAEGQATSPQGKSPATHIGKASADSSSKLSSASQVTPEGGGRKTSCPDAAKELDTFQDSNSVTAATRACALDGAADMEDEDSLYRVERKTETPESKRRSLKVSRSEVKLFRKYVPLNPKQSPAESGPDVLTAGTTSKDDRTDKRQTEVEGSLQATKKADGGSKPAVGRLTDKINIFERQQPADGPRRTYRAPRSADVSPVRTGTDRAKASLALSDQRSRSAEGLVGGRSASVSPARARLTTIEERGKMFAEPVVSKGKPSLPRKPTTTGMSQQTGPHAEDATSKTQKLDSQGVLDPGKQTKAVSVTLKARGKDGISGGEDVSTSSVQLTDSQTKETSDKGTTPLSVRTDAAAEEPGDSAELGPHPRTPSRTGSRSKRRKSKEPTSPIGPSDQNKPECLASKPKVTAIKQVDKAEEPVSASEPHAEKASLSSHKVQENTLDKQPPSDAKQKTLQPESEAPESDVSFRKKNTDKKPDDRREGEPVRREEPDTAARSKETKKPIDERPVILPRKESKAERHSIAFTQKEKNAADENRDTPASSPKAEPSAEESPAVKREPHIQRPELDQELSIQLESKSKEKGRKPNRNETQPVQSRDSELINQAQTKNAEESEKPGREKTNQTAATEGGKAPEFLPSDESASKGKISQSGAENEDGTNKKEQLGKDTTKPAASRPERTPRTAPAPPEQTQRVSQDTSPEKAPASAVVESNEAMSGSKGDKKPWKVKAASKVPPELQAQPAESAGRAAELALAQAKPQPKSVSVEKTENSLDDSCAHGANDAELSSAKPITKATTAVEKGTVKVSNDTPAPISARSSVSPKVKAELYGKEGGGKGGGQDSVSKALPAAVSGDVTGLTPHTDSTSDSTSLKNAEKTTQSPPGSAASSSTFKGAKKPAGETSEPPGDKVSLTSNGDVSPKSQVQPPKEEPIIQKPSQTPKTPTSPEAKKLSADSIQRSPVKKLPLPRGLATDSDSSKWQDAPSSWLDVDFPIRKLKVQEAKLTSSGSESNLLDAPDLEDDDFIQRIKNLCAPFSLPPRKHNPLRQPQPPFAMPAIREDRFEKVFDPEEFTIGLRKKAKFTLDTTQSLLSKHQIADSKSGIKPARASIADRCSLLSSLDTHSRFTKTTASEDEGVKEDAGDQIRVKSRLEGSCVLSSLTASSFRGKRNGAQTLAEGTSSGSVSPTDSPQASPPPVSPAPPPSPTNAAPFRDAPSERSREEAGPGEAAVCDSGPPLPSFNDLKLPDYLQKYLPQEQAGPAQSARGQDQVRPELTGKMTTPAPRVEVDAAGEPAAPLPDRAAPRFPGIPPGVQPAVPPIQQLPAQPHGNVGIIKREFHKRPGKMVLFEKAQFNGQAYEIYRDLADATSLQLSPLISVKVVRGCWVLYEKPDFQGRTIALEEGGSELANMWADPEVANDPQNGPPMQIGSIRLAVGDYSIPHIDLFTEPEGRGRVTPYHDDTIETGSFGIPQSTASIRVHSGVWLVCSDPGFQGMIAVLERGEYPFPETWGFPSPFVGSLRPLKMGGFKVENPNEIKAVLYEKPGFEGCSVEIDSDVFSFAEGVAAPDASRLKSVGSLRITGGFWVGYSQPGFEGQQHILEEGEYLDRNDWGGSELLSLRPILSDFMTPHLKMFSDRDFGKLGVDIDLSVPVINMDDTGYGMKTQSIDVISGVWVVFEEPGFCGEPYVLEKGLYGSPEDWGAPQHRVGSTMPVLLDDFENAAKFKVQLFSKPGFQGSVLSLEDGVASLQDGFTVASCKVLAGSWLAFELKDFTGKVYVLEEGSYPDLRAMGCLSANASIQSLQPVGFEFSLPSVTLFERAGLRGKRVVLRDGSVNLPFTGGCGRVQSVAVEGGIWVLYEGINYRGAQILLKPGQVPDWRAFSGWQKIGSLRPLTQKQVHFRLRNKQTGLMMSVTGELDDVKLMRIQEAEETGGFEQIWFYHNGHLHCKLLEEYCLSPVGSVIMPGSRVGLGQETAEQTHRWSITPEGFIRYTHTSDLVLEIKGGHHYDKNQVILNTLDPNKVQQRWDVEVI